MPTRGSGCEPCRARRKKCDEARPVCHRCARMKRDCFGFRSPFSTILDENRYASGQSKRPRGLRSKEASGLTELVLSRDIPAEATAYYMRRHLEPTQPGEAASRLSHSPWESLVSIRTTDPALTLARSSVALALFSRTRQCPSAAVQARVSYQESLQALRNTLLTLNTDNVDACLLAICLLGDYENVSHERSRSDGSYTPGNFLSKSHGIGAMAVLKYWVDNRDPKQAPTRCIKHARRFIRRLAVLRQIDLPEWLSDGLVFGEEGREYDLDMIIVRIIRVRHDLVSLMNQTNSSASQVEMEVALPMVKSALKEAQAIDQLLWEWIEQFADKEYLTSGQSNGTSSRFGSPSYDSQIYSHSNQCDADILAHYYAYMLLAKQTEIQALEIMNLYGASGCPQEQEDSMKTLEALANQLKSVITFCLTLLNMTNDHSSAGRVVSIEMDRVGRPCEMELIVLPLVIASAIEYLSNEHNQWFKLQLGNVGRALGYGLLDLAATSDWIKL